MTALPRVDRDRKSTRLNSSHLVISYAVFCLKKKETAVFYAGYLLAVKGLRDRGERTLHVMAVTSTISAVFLFPVALASGEQMLPSSLLGWRYLLGLALVSHAAGQGLIAYALAHLRAAFSSVSLLFQPVMAAFFAWVLLGEALVPLQIAGGIVVLIGIYLARRGSN